MPRQTPRVVIQRFYSVAADVLQSPVMKQKLAQLAVDPLPMTPGQFDKYVAEELEANRKLFPAAASI